MSYLAGFKHMYLIVGVNGEHINKLEELPEQVMTCHIRGMSIERQGEIVTVYTVLKLEYHNKL